MQTSTRDSAITGFAAVFVAAMIFVLLLGMPQQAQAAPLSYLNGLCTMDDAALDEEVQAVVQQLRWTRRFSGPGSQFRKHIEGHADEIMDALEATQTRADCSYARKSRATHLWAMISATRSGY